MKNKIKHANRSRKRALTKVEGDELRRLTKENGGLLSPEAVLDAARNKTSPIHGRFEWNKSVAAHKYNLIQAGELIRVYVTVIEADGPKEIRAFVSLSTDRIDGGGYRLTTDVLSDKDWRAQMLADALNELQTFKQKYRALSELSKVFAAIDATVDRKRKKK